MNNLINYNQDSQLIQNVVVIMNKKDPKLTALQFNEFINNQDIKGLTSLMTKDHTFIDIPRKVEKGRELMKKNWISFFEDFPDYKNIFTRVESQDNFVVLIGYSTCSYKPLDGPAIWTATIENDLVAKWQIFEDTEDNRKELNII